MFRDLARLALDWWFDEFERDASPITLGNARLLKAVVDTALAEESQDAPQNHTLAKRRFGWLEVAAAAFEGIEVSHQRTRIHGSLGYVSPEAFEAATSVG